jgi:hypothetical protein
MRVDSISMAEYWSLARQQPEYLTIWQGALISFICCHIVSFASEYCKNL